MTAGSTDLRQAVVDLLTHVELDDVATVHVTAERWLDTVPDRVAVRLEHQPADVVQASGRVQIRYSHRATFFDEDDTPIADPDQPPTEFKESMIGRVEATHVVTLRVADEQPLDERTVHAFAEADAYYMTYPYVRQTLHQLADSVALPPLVLPLLTRTAS